jgi:hypothetical protein
MKKLSWCGTRKTPNDATELLQLKNDLRELCSAVLGVYLNAEIQRDRGLLAESLDTAVDRALVVACRVDKENKFGLF